MIMRWKINLAQAKHEVNSDLDQSAALRHPSKKINLKSFDRL